jgi:hypothetical protein
MSEDDRGIYDKYEVRKNGEPVEDWCFILEIDDPVARQAMLKYAEETDNEKLTKDLREIVDQWGQTND